MSVKYQERYNNSTSFVIPINAVSDDQKTTIKKYIDSNFADKWIITITDKCIYGYTFFYNSEFKIFVYDEFKLNKKYIHWSDVSHKINDLDLDVLNLEVIKNERKDKLKNLKNKK